MTPEKKKKGGAHLEKKPTRETKKKKNRTRDEIIRRRVIVLAVVAAVITGEVVEPGENPGVEVSSDRKKGVYTFLLLGRDTGGGGNTDTMMVATSEKKKKGGAHLEKKPTRETKKKKNRTRDEIIRRRVIVLAVVAAVMLLLAVGLKLWIREPALPTPPVNTGEVVEPGENPGVEVSSDRKKGVYTFLLLGRDTGGGGNTDTMMVATYDTVGQTVNVLNIYRDTMVNAPWDIKRINSVYNFNGGGEEGIQALKEYLQKLIGFSPDFYITVEWNAVGELVDAIGGVEFDVPYEMHYYDPTQNLRIDQAKGLRTLS